VVILATRFGGLVDGRFWRCFFHTGLTILLREFRVRQTVTTSYHLTQAHAFIDGNKRIGAAAAELFVRFNGASLQMTNDEIVEAFLKIAASEMTRDEVEQLFEQRIVKT
ncbi:MAG: type II toxin-antitoxin system death-on-curing family toxin, partial [Blastocatellia bacterium]